eukprot:NODE_435_length_7481_cov_1.616364.p4 type:complete len:276 gc:universal NODE_435_length_7481_cov_1.616364:6500-7327(+)
MFTEKLPKLYFSGTPKAGTSSIHRVIFNKLSPNETLFLEPTHKVEHYETDSVLKLNIYDIPFDLLKDTDVSDGHLIFVHNSQDPQPLEAVLPLIAKASLCTILLHKRDGVPEEVMLDLIRESQQRLSEEDIDAQVLATSIYDSSIFEGLSLVLQKHLNTPALENVLNITCSLTFVEKLYLLDTSSKLYISMDSASLSAYDIISDSIDMIVDCLALYTTNDIKKSQIALSHVHLVCIRVHKELVLIGLTREMHPITWHNLECISEQVKDILKIKSK